MITRRLLFCVAPLIISLAGCATAPTVDDPHHDPANASAMESPSQKSSPSLMENAPQFSLEETNAPAQAPDSGTNNMSGMKGMGGMKDMPGMNSGAAPTSSTSDKTVYTCPMHPEVQHDHPGKCPKCGMTLVPKK